MSEPILMSPTLYGWRRIRGAWHRYYCGRRFGHFRAHGTFLCARCDKRLI